VGVRFALPLVGLMLIGAGCTHEKTYEVPSSAMEPTLRCERPAPRCTARANDRIVVDTGKFAPKRGDIVVFRAPELAAERCGFSGTYVERVIAFPGERVEERAGRIYVDGKMLREPYVTSIRRGLRDHAPVTVRSDTYWVLGDNRASSCDSRVWGPLIEKNLIGKVTEIHRDGKTIHLE
jgi:signal peptidase I